jgi:hypothetical protein
MAYSGTLTIGWASGGTNKTATITKSSTGRVQCEESVANGQTNFEITLPTVDISTCVAVYINSTQDVVFETNSGTPGEGVDVLTLKANEPYVWWTAAPFTNALTTDITTGVFVTNASGSAATVTMEFILDTTP